MELIYLREVCYNVKFHIIYNLLSSRFQVAVLLLDDISGFIWDPEVFPLLIM
jgi:hypothetical protein